MSMQWWRRLLMALLAITGIALAWNHWGMDYRLVIDATTALKVSGDDDRTRDNGNSVATVRREGGKLRMDCAIAMQYEYPFCEMQIRFGDGVIGEDWSNYTALEIVADAQSGGKRVPVRLLVRNFASPYSTAKDVNSHKLHELTFTPSPDPSGLELPLSRVPVASWWLDEHPLPFESSGQDMSNVIGLSVATWGKAPPGLHTISIDRIVLRGKWISAGNLAIGLVAMWVVSMLAFLLVDAWQSRQLLRRSAALGQSLQQLNSTLREQADSYAQKARVDALSGALNRHGLTDTLLKRTRGGGQHLFPASLVFIDVDHFKKVNDNHGHEVGDQVIKGVAEEVRQNVQRQDLLARWGGEEFLLLCPQTRAHEAMRVAERLREAMSSAKWPAGLRLTCSFGVAEWDSNRPLEDAIRLADEAMYEAKRSGRDRVVGPGGMTAAADDPPSPAPHPSAASSVPHVPVEDPSRGAEPQPVAADIAKGD